MKNNYFIAFEGIDGSGKSTQAKLLAERLEQSGHKVYSTFEPTNSRIGSMIKDIFRGKMKADHKTIAALFVADRLDHILNETNGLIKMIEEGYTIITDRYYFSSYAYHGTHMPMDWVIKANSLCAELLRPDLTIFIDVPPEISVQRLHSDRNMIELYEDLDNLKKVRKKYFEAFEKLKHEENIFITDGDLPQHTIFENIWNKIDSILKLNKQPS